MSQYTIINHEVVDLESGEMLGPVVEAGEITSELALETVLDKIGQVESRLAALKLRHEQMRENMAKLEKRSESYLEYLHAVYNEPIRAYASKRLEGAKSKTLTTAYGSVSFRKVKASIKVADNDLAIEAAKTFGWDNAIKIKETFQVSLLTEGQRSEIECVEHQDWLPQNWGFEVVPERESMNIKVIAGGK